MARCPNKNTAEYKVLQSVYKTELQTNNIINAWQDSNNVDTFPTVVEAADYLRNKSLAFNLKRRSFKESLLNNLRRERIIHQYQNNYYINNSNANTREYDESTLNTNRIRLQRYLEINNIPADRVSLQRTPKTFRVVINENLFSEKDILPESRSWDTPRARAVVMHLKRMFPQVNIQMLSVSEASALFDSMPDWKKKNTPFNKVNSFYVDGVAYLIKGRITDEMAIEEMLHPFIDAIAVDNPELFDNLLIESIRTFPELSQEIQDSYNSAERSFSQKDRDLEIVTQALSRHFNKEYENGPSQGFLNRVKEFLQWLATVINNLNEYLTGRPILVSDINANTSMSDIAKLLNTEGIQFKLESRVDGSIRFSLTPEKQKVVDSLKQQAAGNKIQLAALDRLFHMTADPETYEQDALVANLNDPELTSPIITFNEKDHQYRNITTGKKMTSATTAIKGTLANQEEIQLNLDLGNDVDTLLNTIASDQPFSSAVSQLTLLTQEQAAEVWTSLSDALKYIAPPGSILIPQVILYDTASEIAGTADLLVLKKNGEFMVLDLKTSKNSLSKLSNSPKSLSEKAKGRGRIKLYDEEFNNSLKPDSLLKQRGVSKLSTRAQHSLQVNMYRRMLENMGFKVDNGSYGASTLHFTADISGKGKNQKFNGKIEFDSWQQHDLDNTTEGNLNKLIKIDNSIERQRQAELNKNEPEADFEGKDVEQENDPVGEEVNRLDNPETETIISALRDYRIGIIDKQKALQMIKSKVFMKGTKKEKLEELASQAAYITYALSDEVGSAGRSTIYTGLLRDALKQIQEFTEYIEDPNNVQDIEYITAVLNFNRFIKTFEGLYSIKEAGELNNSQLKLISNIQIELNKLTGGSALLKGEPGLIDNALMNYVKQQIRTRSNRDFGGENSAFTEEDLEELLTYAPDITDMDYQTRDMATSPDVILALMDKIYKAAMQKMLDKISVQKDMVLQSADKLVKLSSETDTQKIYNFMAKDDGTYVEKIGPTYKNKQFELRQKTFDTDGKPRLYYDIPNTFKAKPEELEHNRQLAEDKAALGRFFSAEQVDDSGNIIDGDIHRYNQEFKDARDYHEYAIINTDIGFIKWKKRATVSEAEYIQYKAKYFLPNEEKLRPVYFKGEPTGATVFNEGSNAFPKPEYREIKDDAVIDGQSVLSPEYIKIMNPTDALGQAQKEYYEMWTTVYKQQLEKLPPGHVTNMLGRLPVVQQKMLAEVKGKKNFIARKWAETVENVSMFTQGTSQQKGVTTDELGNVVSTLPIYFTGNARVEGELEKLEAERTELKSKRKKNKIRSRQYDIELKKLNGKIARLRATPTVGQISKDLTDSLLKFIAMAQNYETMSTVEDTLNSMVKVLEQREYGSPETDVESFSVVEGAVKKVGQKISSNKLEANAVRRAKKWMSMTFYDNHKISKGMFDKVADKLIQISSLTYVAFNPFGNFNNYVIGRVNNNIEMLGQRFFNRSSYLRAVKVFNQRAIPDIVSRTSYYMKDLGYVATFGAAKGVGKTDYDPEKANSKYEGFVDMFRMMDKMTDIREQGADTSSGQSWFAKAAEWGYVLQDAAEYNVQTKVGMAMLMDTTLKNSTTGETLSLYDAFTYNPKTHKNELKEGYDTVVEKGGREVAYNDEYRYDLRNKIREVNKQIHGNYAKEDRMVIQSTTLGNLAAQFHKWVMPAFRARYQREYFDENLGWMEGRYISALKFINYALKTAATGNLQFNTYKEGFLKDHDWTGKGGNIDQRAENKLFGFYRTAGEIGIMISVFLLSELMQVMLAGDDDDSELTKRFKNIAKYQADRTYKELVLFTPHPSGLKQQYQMFKSPIAATRTLGELGEALSLSFRTPIAYIYYSDKEFKANSEYVYQNKPRKGELKLAKNWKDVVPIWYTFQKWDSYLKNSDFFIK